MAQQNDTAKVPEAATNTICAAGLANNLMFNDFKDYMLITNAISSQQYVYWKKKQALVPVKIDSNLVKRIYLDYLKDAQAYKDYMAVAGKAQFKPKIKALCPYDDSTVLGCLVTYTSDTSIEDNRPTVNYTQMLSIVEIGLNKPAKIWFVDNTQPIQSHDLDVGIFAWKKTVYVPLFQQVETLLQNGAAIKMFVRLKKQQSVYSVDKIMPYTMNEYLVTNEVYYNYNRFYCDNGYALMSLSNYLVNLETEQKIYLPIEDSVFQNIRIDPKTFMTDFYVDDFKFNKAEHKFYIMYQRNGNAYVASFAPNAKVFAANMMLYPISSDFCTDLKNICLSWDGKQVVYCLKGEQCFNTVAVGEIQEVVRNYKHTAPVK
jgi:hypothetical protein